MGRSLIPNVGTVSDQLMAKDRLMIMICQWHRNGTSFNNRHWRNDVPDIDLDRLERECGIRFRRWNTPWANNLYQVADFEVIDEKIYAWFLLKYA
jgi:hypothetical protein